MRAPSSAPAEASLQLSAFVLEGMGLDERIVDDIVDRERDAFAAALDDARERERDERDV